jgi:endoglucanase
VKRIDSTARFAWILLLSLAAVASCGGGSSAANAAPPPPAAPVTSGMRDLTSLQLSAQMSPGWNLGNSLEATGGETAWGNPATTQALVTAVKAAGFRSIRIPVSWHQYADAHDNIGSTWMARVTQVVNYAKAAGLYTVINVHWDGGWLQPTYASQPVANARLAKYWTQIANNFKAFDDTLLFAGTNEVMVTGDYGAPTAEYAAVQNGFNQVFVNAVRATGGNNAVRHLIVQGFNTNIDYTLAVNTLPTDTATRRLMMEIHFYDPYDFTLNGASSIWQWGAGATDPAATEPWGNEAHVDAQFQKMKAAWVDKGVPVILGEYGVISRPDIAGSQAYRQAWDRYVTHAAFARGIVPFYWDNGTTGDSHTMALFDRATGRQADSAIIGALVNAAK